MKRRLTTVIGGLVMGLGLLAASTTASAALQSEGPFEGNDCSGVLGTFPDCSVNGSPIIVKFNVGGETEISSTFPSITGDEFEFSPDPLGGTSGTWTYTPDDPEDPDIRYWVAKAGNEFFVFWEGDADPDSAEIVFTGEWTTTQGLSHLGFYDTFGEVPEPGTLGLLGLTLAGLALIRRRRRS